MSLGNHILHTMFCIILVGVMSIIFNHAGLHIASLLSSEEDISSVVEIEVSP